MSRGWAARAATVSVAVALATVGLGMPGSLAAEVASTAAAAQEVRLPPSLPPARDANHLPTLDATLQDDLAAGAPVNPASAARTGELRPPEGTPVTVVVEADDPAAARAAVEAVGGEVTVELEDRVQADVLATELAELATADGVSFVREPIPVQSTAMSEGVASTGASAWQTSGWSGSTVEVAVLDVGFAGYLSQVGPTGELGPDVVTDFTRCTDGQDDSHGTATAEIVHDIAPESPLHLVCVETEEGLISAIQSMAARGVRVVNGSISITGVGRGDGSGAEGTTVAGALRALRRQGILFVGSAGNYGENHFHIAGTGDNPPNPADLVNLTPGDPMYPDALEFQTYTGDSGIVTLQWDEWTGPRTDFDLYLFNQTCGGWIGESERDQTAGATPVEWIVFDGCGGAAFEVYVNRYAGSGTPRLDFYFDGHACCLERETPSSLPEPASSEAVLSVGAHCNADGSSVRSYSGRGPTIDGRVGPDLTGPDGVSSSVYGGSYGLCLYLEGNPVYPGSGFLGTSASAPHVAGAAALLLEANPGLDVAELQALLEGRATDAGAVGRDNAFGAGRLTMGPSGSSATPAPLAFTPMVPVRLYDTRSGQAGASEAPPRSTPVGPGQFLQVPVRGVAGVPADAVAVALNVTVTGPTANSHLTVQPEATPSTTSNLNFTAGQTVAQQVTATVGSANSVRIFNAAGNSHVIVDVAGWYGPNSAPGVPAADRFNALDAPVRAFDSRAGQGYSETTNRTTRLATGEQVVLDLDLPGGIPVGATAAIVNLTVAQGTTAGHLTAFPADASAPSTSNLNFAAGKTVANLAVVPLDANGAMRLRSEGTTHAIVDVIGWFQDGVGAGYVALSPTRVLDTRTGTGLRRGPITTSSSHDQIVGRYTGVPADAEAVVMGVVAVAPTANSHLTVFPTGESTPTSSTLNFAAGRTVPNAVVAALGTDGKVRFVVAAGSVHLVADVSGYFLDPANVPVPLGSPP